MGNYLKRACHPVTGLSAEYAEFDGTPYQPVLDQWGGRHDWYYSDAYRTIANIALDYEWFAKDEWESENVDRFLNFFCDTVQEKDRDGIFLTDGTILEGKALHPVAMTAVNAQAALASDQKNAFLCVHRFWETPLRTGDRSRRSESSAITSVSQLIVGYIGQMTSEILLFGLPDSY